MTEREYKFLLTEKQFTAAMEKAQSLYGTPKEKIQKNHYYDDETLSLNRHGVTVRIRQAGGTCRLQIKRHDGGQNGCTVSEETEQEITGEPGNITLPEFDRLSLKGCLVTRRHSFAVCPGVSLDMDENTYLSLTDYEAEIEFDSKTRKQRELVISALELKSVNHTSKSARFFAALERMGEVDEL